MQIKAIKLGEDHVLKVSAAPYGSPQDRDSDGQYFSPRTDFALDKITPIPFYFHGFKKKSSRREKFSKSEKPVVIGRTIGYSMEDFGPELSVEIDMSVEEGRDTWYAAKNNNAVASSGTIKHLARIDSSGEILYWPMAEISIWPYEPGMPQANKRAIALPALKAAGIDIPDDLVFCCESEDLPVEATGQLPSGDSDSSSHISTNKDSKKMEDDVKDKEAKMTPAMIKMVQDSVAASLKADRDAQKAAQDAEEAKAAEMKAALDAQAGALKAAHDKALEEAKKESEEAIKARRLPFGQAPAQSKFAYARKYENVDEPTDLALAIDVLNARPKQSGRLPEEMYKAAALLISESKDDEVIENSIKAAGIKADEINQSDLAGFGDEWVSEAWSSTLWRRILFETPVVSKIPTMVIPAGADSVRIPLEGDPIVFYRTPQASDQTANPGRPTPTVMTDKMRTLNNVITPTKVTGATTYSEEITEDSIIMWASEVRRMLTQRAMEVLEHMVIDGDTETGATANINHIGGTPTARDIYTAFDGFRKLALITTPSNALDAAGLDVTDYLDTVKLMGKAGRNARNKAAVSFITDMNTNWATLNLTEVKNRDYMPQGANPVVSGGNVTSLWGYDVIPSGFMHDVDANLLANAAGKIDQTTPANNTKGSILAVRWDQWKLGYKRAWSLEVDKDIYSDSHVVVMHARLGMIARDGEAAAISYNVTV